MIARAIRGQDFGGLIAYLVKNRQLADDAIRVSDNILSKDTAAREMHIVAGANRRCKQPVRHLILAWHEAERPTIKQQHACAEALLEHLGVADHQSVRVVHTEARNGSVASGDGRHFELHIAVNAVGPTGKAPTSTRDWSTIERATAWIAAAHGFAEIPGRFNGVGDGPQSNRNGKAKSFAAQTGVETIADELIADPDKFQALKDARNRSRVSGSWDELLQAFDDQGLRLQQGKDRGPKRVRGLILVDKNNSERRQKISALDTPNLKWGEGALSAELGAVPEDLAIRPDAKPKASEELPGKAESSSDTSDFEAECQRRMKGERSTLRNEFAREQGCIRTERARILAVKTSAWRRFQGRRAELLEAARSRRKLIYKLFPKSPLIRAGFNALLDRRSNAEIQAARKVFETEKELPLPEVQRWATWSPSWLKAARTRVEQDLRAEMAEQAAEQERRRQAATAAAENARQKALAANQSMIRNYWRSGLSPDPDQVVIRWNSTVRAADTVASIYLVKELRKAGVPIMRDSGIDTARVSASDLAEWIGTESRGNRIDRATMMERAATSSFREVDALRAEEEKQREIERTAKDKAERLAWAANWVRAAPKSAVDANRIVWLIPPHASSSGDVLLELANALETRAERGTAYRALSAGYQEISVDAAVMVGVLADIEPAAQQHWDERGAAYRDASRASHFQRQNAAAAQSWADAWIGNAPRSALALEHCIWTLSPDRVADDPYANLCALFDAYPDGKIAMQKSRHKLTVDTKSLRHILEAVDVHDRGQWDRVGIACAAASRDNDNQIEQLVLRSFDVRQERIEVRQAERSEATQIKGKSEFLEDPPKAKRKRRLYDIVGEIMSALKEELFAGDYQEAGPIRNDLRPNESASKAKISTSGQRPINENDAVKATTVRQSPFSTESAAWILAKKKFARTDKGDNIWVLGHQEVLSGSIPKGPDMKGYGLIPMFERIGIKWDVSTYNGNDKLVIYKTSFRNMAQVLGDLSADECSPYFRKLSEATAGSVEHYVPTRDTISGGKVTKKETNWRAPTNSGPGFGE